MSFSTPTQWSVLSATGTSHLVSISGMHVTLLAGWLAWLASALWRRIPALAIRIPAATLAAIVSLPVAALYAGLAGWGIPAQRTVVTLALGTACLLSGHRARALDLWCLACAGVIAANPWCASSPGFLLSFGAVAVLIFSSSGRKRHMPYRFPRLQSGLAQHATVFLGLMPLSMALFGQYSWVSPVANLLAIGWMSFVTTPLVLVGTLLNLEPLMNAAHLSLQALWPLLQWLADLPFAWSPIPQAPWLLTALSILGGFLVLLPAGFLMRLPGLVLLALPLIGPQQAPRPGEFELTVLDIGQGNSIAIRTARHILLVDAGNAPNPRQDQGRLTILPWLQSRGKQRWDAMLVSHNDMDHRGGIDWLVRHSQVDQLIYNPPFSPPADSLPNIIHHEACIQGLHWEWDGVRFDVLYPGPKDLAIETEDNARSCVLRVHSPFGSALLPGDIGEEQERRLIERFSPRQLAADILIAPHHGSHTSSSPDFIQATQKTGHIATQWVVFQMGYRNRYRHPDPDVTRRWEAAGFNNLRTDQTGALQFSATASGMRLKTARQRRKRFWHLNPDNLDNSGHKPQDAP